MAKSHARAVQQAQSAQTSATRIRDWAADAGVLVDAHGDNDFSDINGAGIAVRDAEGNLTSGYLNLAPDGNIAGMDISPADYLTYINACTQIRAFMSGDPSAVPGDYASVIGRIARARG